MKSYTEPLAGLALNRERVFATQQSYQAFPFLDENFHDHILVRTHFVNVFSESARNNDKFVVAADFNGRAGRMRPLRSISLDFWDFVELGTGNIEFLQAVGDWLQDVKDPERSGLNVEDFSFDGSDGSHSSLLFYGVKITVI